MKSQPIPKELSGFDSELLGRLTGQAETIIRALAARRLAKRPEPRERIFEINFPRGTSEFLVLHRFVTNTATCVALLNYTLASKLSKGPEWRFSPADSVLTHNTNSESFTIMMHPVDLDVRHLSAVPDEVRIFRLDHRPPFAIFELTVASPDSIARERAESATSLGRLRAELWQVIRERATTLLETLRAEHQRQRATLDSKVSQEVTRLLHEAMNHPQAHLYNLLEVAHYLGVIYKVTAAFRRTV